MVVAGTVVASWPGVKKSGRFALGLLFMTLSFGKAHAISRHEGVKAVPFRQKGKLVGFKLTMVLKSQGFNVARVGLGRSSVREELKKKGWDAVQMRRLVETEDMRYIRLTLPDATHLSEANPRELELEVRYGEGNDLKPGDVVDVYSAWKRETDRGYQHFFGVFEGGDHHFTSVKLPSE